MRKRLHLKLFDVDNPSSFLRAFMGWPLLTIGLYMLAALIGSHIPANNDWRQPLKGIDIFVETNGVHVSLIIPIAAAGQNISDLIRPDQLTRQSLYGTHAMVGWGHKGVYRNAQDWDDVKSGDVASAIIGSDETTLHVYHLIDPKPLAYRRIIRVSPDQFRIIISQIRSMFRLDASGQSLAYPAYGPDNLFYDSVGHYNLFNTCNSWTGKVLRNAGVRIGVWTPMPGGVMRWFDTPSIASDRPDRQQPDNHDMAQ